MNVLLLSAYAASSHVYWQRRLQEMFSDWSWQVLSLPPRHFSWRVRGNPLHWALEERRALEQKYDLVVATSMVDLATLRGLVPALALCPTVLYFHENQFAYPQNPAQPNTTAVNASSNLSHYQLLEAQMVSLYAALAADAVAFNSRFNRDTFGAGSAALLKKLPDYVPPGVVAGIEQKASVVPVPLSGKLPESHNDVWPAQSGPGVLRIVWVGRFEYDKGPEALLHIVANLDATGVEFELALVGQQFRDSPAVFNDLRESYTHRIVHYGYMESHEDYFAILSSSDVVLSTALHEFQGLSVLEAVSCGAVPVVPDRLVYPDIFPAQCRYASLPGDAQGEARAATNKLLSCYAEKQADTLSAPDVSRFSIEALRRPYELLFESAMSHRDGS